MSTYNNWRAISNEYRDIGIKHLLSVFSSMVAGAVVAEGTIRIQRAVEIKLYGKEFYDSWKSGLIAMLIGLLMFALFLWILGAFKK